MDRGCHADSAILAGGYKYQSTARGNQAQQAVALLEDDGEGEADAAEVIVNPNVTHYELAIESWEKELEAMEAYISSSAIMQLDAYHLDTGSLTFYVSAGGQASTDALVRAFESFATDGRLAAAMYETNGSIAVSELQYLIEFDSTGTSAAEISYGEVEGGETPLEIQFSEPSADGSGGLCAPAHGGYPGKLRGVHGGGPGGHRSIFRADPGQRGNPCAEPGIRNPDRTDRPVAPGLPERRPGDVYLRLYTA